MPYWFDLFFQGWKSNERPPAWWQKLLCDRQYVSYITPHAWSKPPSHRALNFKQRLLSVGLSDSLCLRIISFLSILYIHFLINRTVPFSVSVVCSPLASTSSWWRFQDWFEVQPVKITVSRLLLVSSCIFHHKKLKELSSFQTVISTQRYFFKILYCCNIIFLAYIIYWKITSWLGIWSWKHWQSLPMVTIFLIRCRISIKNNVRHKIRRIIND